MNKKREFRELEQDVKMKIGNSLRNKSKSPTHRNNISKAMVDYWKSIPNKPTDDKPSPTETGEVI